MMDPALALGALIGGIVTACECGALPVGDGGEFLVTRGGKQGAREEGTRAAPPLDPARL